MIVVCGCADYHQLNEVIPTSLVQYEDAYQQSKSVQYMGEGCECTFTYDNPVMAEAKLSSDSTTFAYLSQTASGTTFCFPGDSLIFITFPVGSNLSLDCGTLIST